MTRPAREILLDIMYQSFVQIRLAARQGESGLRTCELLSDICHNIPYVLRNEPPLQEDVQRLVEVDFAALQLVERRVQFAITPLVSQLHEWCRPSA